MRILKTDELTRKFDAYNIKNLQQQLENQTLEEKLDSLGKEMGDQVTNPEDLKQYIAYLFEKVRYLDCDASHKLISAFVDNFNDKYYEEINQE